MSSAMVSDDEKSILFRSFAVIAKVSCKEFFGAIAQLADNKKDKKINMNVCFNYF